MFVEDLGDPQRGSIQPLVTSPRGREAIHETQSRGGVSIAFAARYLTSGHVSRGYEVTLIFKNESSTTVLLTPAVTVSDSSGLELRAMALDAYVAQASMLAGTSIPAGSATVVPPGRTTTQSDGTLRDSSSGRTYTYSAQATTTPSSDFASGFSQGLAQSQANAGVYAALADRERGLENLSWAQSYWLKSAYSLPPGASSVGALFLPAPSTRPLPLTVVVDAGGQRFQFQTRSK
jgi:hypothetical protein